MFAVSDAPGPLDEAKLFKQRKEGNLLCCCVVLGLRRWGSLLYSLTANEES